MNEPQQIWIDTPEGKWTTVTATMAVFTVIVPMIMYRGMQRSFGDIAYQMPTWILWATVAYFFVATIASYAMLRRVKGE